MSEVPLTFSRATREETNSLPDSWRHAVHILIYAKTDDSILFGHKLPAEHTILMQTRFDGRLGFPGGFVDYDDKSLEDALMRELREEMGEIPHNFQVTPEDYMFATLMEPKKYCLHFFCKEVTFDEFLVIERRDTNVKDFEVLGIIRVPLYTWRKLGGFPAFLRNNFIGYSKEQLISCIRMKKLLPEGQLDELLARHKQYDPLSNSVAT
ncbi:U8 snoRNA-decapping enzyme-like [Hydractinia symbiolongicarpus]|uniref:U8 snoRNA-decapping enzyme-like n=1 Tax=Hydractinia symbiolongicarpus TaxID=13093 RepID=UPI00254D1E93|nr:U8 snoRNA-decapping enzyme-like [Hydractinia symbiolongicarpus]